MRTPKGHIRRRGNRYEIAVPVGRDPITKRYRYAYDYADSEEQAERRRADLIDRITKGRTPQARATVSDLIDRWLSVAELELITTVNYQSYIERVIRPVLGGLQLREIQDQVEVLDELYAQLRRCRRLCGGRPGLVDHRPVGQGRRRPDGEPDHECDERWCPIGARPPRRRRSTRFMRSCTGRSPSRSSGGGWTATPRTWPPVPGRPAMTGTRRRPRTRCGC